MARSGLGQLKYLRGDYEAAIPMLERALAEQPGAYATLMGLVVTCWKTGRMAEARHYAEIFRALVPELTISGFLRDSPDRVAAWRRDSEDALRAVGVPE